MSTHRAEDLKAVFAENDTKSPKDVTLFWHPTGPKISYGGGVFKVSSLNPESPVYFRMSAKDMLQLGWRCIVIAWRIR